EFQDTNPAQYEMAKLLAGQYRNLCVVGDPDQSIYSWRHADLRNILDFEQDFPEAKAIYLEQNYRSTQTILEAASNIIALNQQRKPKRLWTDNERGLPITLMQSYSEEDEAQFVARQVERLSKQGLPLKECAVMYRTNAQSRAVEAVLLRYGIPHRLVGALRFYHRREIKDLLAYLRFINNPHDEVSLGRIINVPLRGIGSKTLAQLSLWADSQGISTYQALSLSENGGLALAPRLKQALAGFYSLMEELRAKSLEVPVAQLMNEVVERIKYQEYLQAEDEGDERWDNVLELRNVASDYAQPGADGLSAFLETVSLVSDVDNLDEKAEAVTLVTLHQAKGLEFA
ncbi:MAG: 3'-5' exonuclease, partial [Chloroflexota bacterium]